MKQRKLVLKSLWLVAFLAGTSLFLPAQRVLTIEQALDIAEENNPSMRIAKLNLEQRHYNLVAQRASLRPQLSFDVNPFAYSQTRNFDSRFSDYYTSKRMSSDGVFRASLPILPTDGRITVRNTLGWAENTAYKKDGTTSNAAYSNNLQLTYDQPIFTYNRQKMQLKVLEFEYENAQISYALQRLRTEQSITSQFYNVHMAMNRLNISREELENSQKNYAIIKYRVDADLAAKEELYQAEVNLATAQSSVETDNVNLNNLKDQLKQTLGMPLSEEIDVSVKIEVKPMLIVLDNAIQHGLNSRMELRQREIAIEQAELTMITVKAMNEFSGNIGLAVGVTGDNEKFTNIYQDPVNSPRVAISFSIPIYDFGQKKARIQAQKTAQVIAQLNYDEEVVGIELAIRQSLRRLENIKAQISIQEKQVENTQRTYELNQIRYQEGDLTGMQMSLFQTQLSSSRSSLAQQQINYKTELLNLKILTLYDYDNDRPVVPVKELNNITMR